MRNFKYDVTVQTYVQRDGIRVNGIRAFSTLYGSTEIRKSEQDSIVHYLPCVDLKRMSLPVRLFAI